MRPKHPAGRMRRLRHQQQKHGTNCGPTCVAILGRTSQERASLAMFGEIRDRNLYSWWPQIKRGLKEFGIRCERRARAVSKWQSIRSTSIVSVSNDDHWVVYSKEDGVVYDPMKPNPVPIGKFRKKPFSYLPVRPLP
jgi:hypothetical protein